MPYAPAVQPMAAQILMQGQEMGQRNMMALASWLEKHGEEQKQIKAQGKLAESFYKSLGDKAPEITGITADQLANKTNEDKYAWMQGFQVSQAAKSSLLRMQADQANLDRFKQEQEDQNAYARLIGEASDTNKWVNVPGVGSDVAPWDAPGAAGTSEDRMFAALANKDNQRALLAPGATAGINAWMNLAKLKEDQSRIGKTFDIPGTDNLGVYINGSTIEPLKKSEITMRTVRDPETNKIAGRMIGNQWIPEDEFQAQTNPGEIDYANLDPVKIGGVVQQGVGYDRKTRKIVKMPTNQMEQLMQMFGGQGLTGGPPPGATVNQFVVGQDGKFHLKQ
jgi:hypothetical protein